MAILKESYNNNLFIHYLKYEPHCRFFSPLMEFMTPACIIDKKQLIDNVYLDRKDIATSPRESASSQMGCMFMFVELSD